MSEKRCCDCEHFGLSKGPIFSLITGICGRCGKEVGYTDKCLFEEKNKGESFLEDIYQIMKEDGLIDVMGGLFLLLGFWVVLYIIAYFIVFIMGMIL